MKKLLALLLCFVLVLPVLAGCTETEDDETTKSVSFEKAPEGYTFTIGLANNLMVDDYETNAFTLWIEEQTGYNLKFVPYATNQDDYRAQISAEFLVPGRVMPDILWGMDLGQQATNDYGVNGKLYDLSPFFESEEMSGAWWDRLNEIEDKDYVDYVVRKMHADDGKAIYTFPTVDYSQYDMIRHNVYINQEWLDALDLDMPESKEELYNVLVKFRDGDPNGNNEKDERPLIGRANSSYGDVVSWIVNMFCYMEDARTWRVDENGKISGFYWDDAYREALIFLNKLVKDGLLIDSSFTMKSSELANLVNPIDGVETVGIWLGHPSLVLTEGSDAVNVYKAMPQWGNAIIDMGQNLYETSITSSCKYPASAWEILMLISSQEGSYRMRYGEKGVDWIDAAEGTKAFTGLDAEINVLNQTVYGAQGNSLWNQVAGTIGMANENERTEVSDNISDWNKAKLELMGDTFKYNWSKAERPADVVMPLIYTAEEDDEISVARTNTTNWYKNSRASFIKGTGDLNDPSDPVQWQKYIDGFRTAGYYEWLEVAQDVYDFTYGDKSGK